jgi:hypothetical protein
VVSPLGRQKLGTSPVLTPGVTFVFATPEPEGPRSYLWVPFVYDHALIAEELTLRDRYGFFALPVAWQNETLPSTVVADAVTNEVFALPPLHAEAGTAVATTTTEERASAPSTTATRERRGMGLVSLGGGRRVGCAGRLGDRFG